MALTQQAFTGARQRPGPPCGIATILNSLPESDRVVLQEALDAPLAQVGHRAIERVLVAEGIRPPTGAVGKHRRKECVCAA